jgi:ubiquinone/menaquinone biosynthesis C-methylase UbiE
MDYTQINKRYSELAESNCCLSCGGAINHANVQQGEICVDLGSGRGTDVIRLAEKTGSSGFAYGIDISEGMIRKSAEAANRLDVRNVDFIHCPLENIRIDSEIADVIISNCTLNHSSDKQAVWNEIYRILKSGGRFIISDIYSTSEVPEVYKNDPVAVAECWAGSVTREEYDINIKNSGFSEYKVIEESAPYDKGRIKVVSWTISGIKP